MIYLEMSRDKVHGGGTWAFPKCLWAPVEKQGGGSWTFWTKILQVTPGDTIIHLRGVPPDAAFVGYSTATGDGFETGRRPPQPGKWDYSERFFRADLEGFTPFHEAINLDDLFQQKRIALEDYFDRNKSRGRDKANIFYVRQSGRLQCLNGAYLSDVDEDLLSVLFGSEDATVASGAGDPVVSVATGSQIRTVRARLGQKKFSDQVRRNYGNRCCFPGCSISDPRFLVGAHITRWTDNEELRGHPGNGLCLCLVHDRAFELGLFTLDEQHRVFVNPKEQESASEIARDLKAHNGEPISDGEVKPLDDALLEHWIRVDIEP